MSQSVLSVGHRKGTTMNKTLDITVERIPHSGALMCTALIVDRYGDEYYVTRTFYGYGKQESVRLMREYLATL